MPTEPTSCSRTTAWRATSRGCARGGRAGRASSSPSTEGPTSTPPTTATCTRRRWTWWDRTSCAASGTRSRTGSRCWSRDCTWSARRAEATIGRDERKDTTMRYLLLIYEREADWGKLPEAEQGKVYQEY